MAALANRPAVDPDDLPLFCHPGIFVARMKLPLGSAATAPVPDYDAGWFVSPWVLVRIKHRIETEGSVPFVATVGGFVVTCAEITGFRRSSRPETLRTAFRLEEPGHWSSRFVGRCFPTGPGGPWLMWTPRRQRRHAS